jgi:site-specific DNA-methyltransferase (adenine-specific)
MKRTRKNKILLGDCLELMKDIPDKSIDMILCDLPYGTTSCKWDIPIPFDLLWKEYKRIINNNGAIVLTAREPFTSLLITSNINQYKHKWIWNKKQSGSYQNAKYMPLQVDEDIIVFCDGKVKYYPIMRKGKLRTKGGKPNECMNELKVIIKKNDDYFPINILDIPNCVNKKNNLHPTQKPVTLFEYLIKTYTNKEDLVLDNCAGSGTTAIACLKTKRNYIVMEKEKKYYDIILNRVKEFNEKSDKTLFGL